MAQLPMIPVRVQGEGISTPNISGGMPVTINEEQICMCVCAYVCTCRIIFGKMESATLKSERKNLPEHRANIDFCVCDYFISDGPKNHAIGNILIQQNS